MSSKRGRDSNANPDPDLSQVVRLHAFLVFLAGAHIAPVKPLLETSAGPVECSHLQRSGGNGIKRLTWVKSEVLQSWRSGKLLMIIRRFATASAIAASSVPALLLARGHRISTVPEIPLVIDSKTFEGAAIVKTSAAVALLKAIGAGPDVVKVQKSRKLRAGKGKMRGRRYRQRRGPLIVYNPDNDGKELMRAFRNIPGVETSSVFALSLLQLAPGGHLGRFIIWTSSAFAALDDIYGTTTTPSALKTDFLLPSNVVSNADITRLINSSEVQSVLREPKGYSKTKRTRVQKKNPLRNRQVLLRLNPYASAFSKQKLGQLSVEKDKTQAAGKEFTQILHEN